MIHISSFSTAEVKPWLWKLWFFIIFGLKYPNEFVALSLNSTPISTTILSMSDCIVVLLFNKCDNFWSISETSSEFKLLENK